MPARVEELCGLVFVNLDPDATPLAELVGDLPARLARYRIETLEPFAPSGRHPAGELEGRRRELPRGLPHPDRPSRPDADARLQALRRRGARALRVVRGAAARQAEQQPARAPVRAAGQPMPGLGEEDRRIWRYVFIYPNTTIDLYPDQVNTWQMLPDGIGRTRDVFAGYRAAGQRPAHTARPVGQQRLNKLVLDEDIDLVDERPAGTADARLPLRPAVAPRERGGLVRGPDPGRSGPGPPARRRSDRRYRPQAERARADPRRRGPADRPRGHRRRPDRPDRDGRRASRRALVHYHFETREALLAEALDYSYARAGDARISARRAAGGIARRAPAVDDRASACRRRQALDRGLGAVGRAVAARGPPPELRPVAEELYARMHAWFADEIAAGVEDGEFERCDPDEVADRTLALIDGFGVRTLIGDAGDPARPARRPGGVEARSARELGLRGDADRRRRSGRANRMRPAPRARRRGRCGPRPPCSRPPSGRSRRRRTAARGCRATGRPGSGRRAPSW